jgi:hypothetical protein
MSEIKTGIVAEKSQGGRYAVIEIRRSEAFLKRLGISYRDEKSLRELLAASSIVGIGFSFRKTAVAVTPNSSSIGAESKSVEEKRAFRREDAAPGLSR